MFRSNAYDDFDYRGVQYGDQHRPLSGVIARRNEVIFQKNSFRQLATDGFLCSRAPHELFLKRDPPHSTVNNSIVINNKFRTNLIRSYLPLLLVEGRGEVNKPHDRLTI